MLYIIVSKSHQIQIMDSNFGQEISLCKLSVHSMQQIFQTILCKSMQLKIKKYYVIFS